MAETVTIHTSTARAWQDYVAEFDEDPALISLTAGRLVALSRWIDASNRDRDPEAVTWGRLAKLTEESGEVIAAYIGYIGQNPRKGRTGTAHDVIEELLDVAVTALGAVEHMTGQSGTSLELLADKVRRVATRVPSPSPVADTTQEQ